MLLTPSSKTTESKIISSFHSVLQLEAKAILDTVQKINPLEVEGVITLLISLKRNHQSLFLTGVGKSATIAKKIADTFASLGLKTFFIHPLEALHGDMGRIAPEDAVILISKSGETKEIIDFIDRSPVNRNKIIALVGHVSSSLANRAGFILDGSVDKEACYLGVAPTTSTTVALAIGDALAVTYSSVVSITDSEFARNHPSGQLGLRLRVKVSSLMIPKLKAAVVSDHVSLSVMLEEMTKYPIGIGCVVDKNDQLVGIIAEGDIRRLLITKPDATGYEDKNLQTLHQPVLKVMNSNFLFATEDDLAYRVYEKMQTFDKKVTVMPIVDANKRLQGIIRLQELLACGLQT